MIVSHRHKFIFLKTFKTAGTSLEIALSEYCGPDDIITKIGSSDEAIRQSLGFRGPQNFQLGDALLANHLPAAAARSILGEEIWTGYFKFTVERCPYDRALSWYWWQARKFDSPPPIVDMLRANPDRLSNWPIYTIADEVAADHVIRYENLAAELALLERRLGIGPLKQVNAKSQTRKDRSHYSTVLDGPSRAIIERACAKEMACFGYRWESAPAA